MLNKPAPDWNAKDLAGKTWTMSGLKGKVVVIDFWYRGCGWCMLAMPQVKQLADDYRDRGVVVLGMNTDQKEEDANLVVKTLGLTYPQIKAQGIPERFGVRAFPTLIIVDQAGVVRTVHAGFRHDLRENLGKRIDALLAKPPS
jgi:thiol-disulfide isomerase/thioredoxin